MGFFLVLKAEVVRGFIIMRRYWFATLTGIIVGYGFLMMLIIAFMANRESLGQLAGRAVPIRGVLGFIVGMFAFGIVGMFSQGIQGMARTGELEQVYMSPHGLVTNFLARSLVSSVMSIISSAVMLTLVAMSLGSKLHADPLPTILLLAMTYANLIGFGFMVGGLVLVFKQVGEVAMLLRLALMGLAVIATDKINQWSFAPARWLAHALPITDAAICLKHVIVDGQVVNGVFVSVFTLPSFYFLIMSCFIWTTIGVTCFKFMENWSRSKGTLGVY